VFCFSGSHFSTNFSLSDFVLIISFYHRISIPSLGGIYLDSPDPTVVCKNLKKQH